MKRTYFSSLLWASVLSTSHASLLNSIFSIDKDVVESTSQHFLASSGQQQNRILPEKIPDSQPVPSRFGNWLGWGADVYNNRWAGTDATVELSNVDELTISCQQKYNPGVSATPLVQNGIAYYPTWGGLLVAYNYSSCETIWQTNVTKIIYEYQVPSNETAAFTNHISRTTPAVHGETLFLGTQTHALLLAVNKRNGRLIDALQISDHPFAIITMSPTVWADKVYVGSSSNEEVASDFITGYKCCSFEGAFFAVNFQHGRLSIAWSQAMVPPDAGFSGAAVWGSQPAIDPIRNQVFVATGNVYSIPLEYQQCQNQTANITVIAQGNTSDPCTPRTVYQESVIAFDVETGLINWANQISPLDAWNLACFPGFSGNNPGGCGTATPGPDADFGIAPTFIPGSSSTPYGQDTLIVGQKNGNLYALSAQAGRVFWALATSPDGVEGGLIWGLAADNTAVYYTGVNSLRLPWNVTTGSAAGTTISSSLFGAASLRDGQILWETPAPGNGTSYVPPTVVNDVVLVGTTGGWEEGNLFPVPPGKFLALDKRSGEIVSMRDVDGYNQGGIAVVKNSVLFGTGYVNALGQRFAGSLNVWTVPVRVRSVDDEL